MTFNEAYERVVNHAEDCDIGQIYYNMGISAEYADDAQKLSVALILVDSGTVHVDSETANALKKASRCFIEFGSVEPESPETRAATMDRMRHLI